MAQQFVTCRAAGLSSKLLKMNLGGTYTQFAFAKYKETVN